MSRSHKSDRQRNKRRTIAESVASEEGESLLVADDATPKPKVEPGVLDSGVDPKLYKTLTKQAIKEAAKERAEELGGYSKPSNRPKVDPTLTVEKPKDDGDSDDAAETDGNGKTEGATASGDADGKDAESKVVPTVSETGEDASDGSKDATPTDVTEPAEKADEADGAPESSADASKDGKATENKEDATTSEKGAGSADTDDSSASKAADKVSEDVKKSEVVPEDSNRSVLADNLRAISEQSGTGDETVDAAVASVEEAIKAVLAMPKGHDRSEKLKGLSSLRADISSGKVMPGDAPASLDAIMDDGAEGNEDAELDVAPSAPVAKESVPEPQGGGKADGSDATEAGTQAEARTDAASAGETEAADEAREETAPDADVESVPSTDEPEVTETVDDATGKQEGKEKSDEDESPLKKYYEKYENQITVPNSKKNLEGNAQQKSRKGRGGRNKGKGKRSRAQVQTMERATVEVKPGTKVKSRDDKDYSERTPEELKSLENADLDVIPSDAEPIDLSTVLTYGNPKLQEKLNREKEAEEKKRGKGKKAGKGERRNIRNPFAPVGHALADTFRDWREVTWPSAGDTAKMSIAVLISLVVFGAATMGVDAGTVEFMKWLTSLRP